MWIEMTNSAILRTLGERLKEYRLRLDLQQSELAAHAGVNVGTVSRIEKGENVSMDSYLRILRSLDMLDNLDEFIPEPPTSLLMKKKLMGKRKFRVKKSKDNSYE